MSTAHQNSTDHGVMNRNDRIKSLNLVDNSKAYELKFRSKIKDKYLSKVASKIDGLNRFKCVICHYIVSPTAVFCNSCDDVCCSECFHETKSICGCPDTVMLPIFCDGEFQST